MAESNRPVAGGRYKPNGNTLGSSRQQAGLGAWADPARLSGRRGVSARAVTSVAPLAKRARARGGLVRRPTTPALAAPGYPAASKPYLSGMRGTGRNQSAGYDIVLPNKPNNAVPLQDGRHTQLKLLPDVQSAPRSKPPPRAKDASTTAGRGDAPLPIAAPQRAPRTSSTGWSEEKRRGTGIRAYAIGRTRDPPCQQD